MFCVIVCRVDTEMHIKIVEIHCFCGMCDDEDLFTPLHIAGVSAVFP